MNEVTLVGITQPQSNLHVDQASDLVAYCARVSNPTNQANQQSNTKLLKYLIEHQHWSPFEMVHLVMEIKTTRDISRQILRHRSFSFQEFSQRYAKSESFTIRDMRMQDEKNRQNSVEPNLRDPDTRELNDIWQEKQHEVLKMARAAYDFALTNGIAREQARSVLPEGLTETTLYMAGTLRSWIHYCQLRMANGTQKEHIEIAKDCWNIITQHFPEIAGVIDYE